MADAFFQALCCQPVTVFGRRLRPFSLSHAYILDALRNGWLSGGNGTRSQLLHAVWVCGQAHETNTREVVLPPLWRMMVFACLSHRYGYEFEREKFLQYLADYMEIPEHWSSDPSHAGKGFRAPWQFHFVVSVAQNCGVSVSEAWNMPVALARCYYDVWAEQQGDETLVSVREKRLAEEEGLNL